jgi:ParB-like chromosome segregation protein Spo0J
MSNKRKDHKGRLLRTGESQRGDLIYQYRYTDLCGKRRSIYDSDLQGLRRKEKELQRQLDDGIDYDAGQITVLELLKSGFINTGHAKVVLGLPTPELQAEAAQIIADNQLNVRQAEALCKKMAKPAKEPREPAPRGTLPVEVEESLKQVLGSEVNVAYHGGKGKLTVHFYSDEQLRAFANLLGQYQMETE